MNVPGLHRIRIPRSNQSAVAKPERDIFDTPGFIADKRSRAVQVPDFDVTVPVAGRQVMTVRTVTETEQLSAVPSEYLLLFTRFKIPEPNGAIEAGRCQLTSVGSGCESARPPPPPVSR